MEWKEWYKRNKYLSKNLLQGKLFLLENHINPIEEENKKLRNDNEFYKFLLNEFSNIYPLEYRYIYDKFLKKLQGK